MLTGYLHPRYADSLAEFGTPRELRRCGGRILQRQIAGFPCNDAMGCYPLFACQDWSQLCADLEDIEQSGLVSLALVADPFGGYEEMSLRRYFDVVIPFKEHFVIDLRRPISSVISGHHRRNIQKAHRDVYVERCRPPTKFIDEWMELYEALIDRHDIKGIAKFSRSSFLKQLQVPGIVVFRAVHEGVTVGMTLWYIQEDVVYYHLGAYSIVGYQMRASFAVFWSAVEYFASNTKLRWINLGAGAGVKSSSTDGLTRFKRGWSTETRTAYLCSSIFDQESYTKLVKAKGTTATDYFPAYRQGEFS